MSNLINARFQLKYDSYQNWKDKNPLLLAGEIAIAKLTTTNAVAPTENDTQAPVLFKVGPGNFNDLPWASALAANVYGWAKAETVDVVDKKLVFKNHDGSEAGSVDFTAFALTAEVEATLASYYTSAEVDAIVEEINNAANDLSDRVDNIENVTIPTLATKAELADVDAKFANYTTTTDLNAALDLKADKTQVATDIETAVNAEKERAMGVEAELRADVDAAATKEYVDATFTTKTEFNAHVETAEATYATKVALGEEATARAEADQAIRDDMATALALKADKTYVDTTFATKDALAAEVERATGIEGGLRTDVDAVIARVNAFLDNTGAATDAIDTLQELLTYIETHDDVEISGILAEIQYMLDILDGFGGTGDPATVLGYVNNNVAALQKAIEDAITAEETARTNADNAIGERIDGVVADLGDEASARAAEDERLAGLISDEVTNRTNADTQIRTDFAAADDAVRAEFAEVDTAIRGELAAVKAELEGDIADGDVATLEAAKAYTDEQVGEEATARAEALEAAVTEVKAYADEAAQAAQAATTYTAGFGIAIDENNNISIDQGVTFIFCAGDASTVF